MLAPRCAPPLAPPSSAMHARAHHDARSSPHRCAPPLAPPSSPSRAGGRRGARGCGSGCLRPRCACWRRGWRPNGLCSRRRARAWAPCWAAAVPRVRHWGSLTRAPRMRLPPRGADSLPRWQAAPAQSGLEEAAAARRRRRRRRRQQARAFRSAGRPHRSPRRRPSSPRPFRAHGRRLGWSVRGWPTVRAPGRGWARARGAAAPTSPWRSSRGRRCLRRGRRNTRSGPSGTPRPTYLPRRKTLRVPKRMRTSTMPRRWGASAVRRRRRPRRPRRSHTVEGRRGRPRLLLSD